MVLQWWTAVAFHTYLILAVAARRWGARVVIELHELQDPGEASFALARGYGSWALGFLLRLSHGCVVHSKADWRSLETAYSLEDLQVAVAPHGPYDQYRLVSASVPGHSEATLAKVTEAPRPTVTNILFFGLIRPYKGLDDLLRVFNDLSPEEAAGLWLTVVGETWDGCTEPARLIESSPYRHRISFVNEYVADEVAAATFAHADVVVLPYRRSSSSGTLHVAMSCGLPVVVASVGGLPEAANGYEGAIFIPPGDLALLKSGIMQATRLVGKRFADPRDWSETIDALLHAARCGPGRLDAGKQQS